MCGNSTVHIFAMTNTQPAPRQCVSVRACTGLSQGARVRGVWVSVVLAQVFGDVVASQLGHNVGDVAERAEVLQPFVSTTWWSRTSITGATNPSTAAKKLRHSIKYNQLFHGKKQNSSFYHHFKAQSEINSWCMSAHNHEDITLLTLRTEIDLDK